MSKVIKVIKSTDSFKRDVRIIIADRKQHHLFHIEKKLNSLGFYRIITASSITEVYHLSKITPYLIDVLIIDAALNQDACSNFNLDNIAIPNIIVYQLPAEILSLKKVLQCLPDINLLKHFMLGHSHNTQAS
ncbi:hypothetical protein [Aeromonas salmonicida]|uniref:hypothetical protein n=1 Tax=Aeromonas salmonicida TaxID=645 RepID=UPI0013A6E69F|nr:hypothetical protein [Aeromonas salmonicida]